MNKEVTLETINEYTWINQPTNWTVEEDALIVVTDEETDFWQNTWYGFQRDSGHVLGFTVTDDFTFQVCIEAEFTTLYDQAGLMIRVDDKNWMKAGIEYNDGQPMISSVLTREESDWSTGIFQGDPKKFWMRLTRKGKTLRLQYSCDSVTWPLLRLCTFVDTECLVGIMCCTPKREGLRVRFTDIRLTEALDKDLHDLS